jgi:hypothetical protein
LTTDDRIDYNPFTKGVAGKYFVGREEQLTQFANHLRGLEGRAPDHIYVAGLHGTGKTSYLERLTHLAADAGFVAAMTTAADKATARDQVVAIVEAIVEKLHERLVQSDTAPPILEDWNRGSESKLFRVPRSPTRSPASDLLLKDFQRLEKYMTQANLPGVVICVDEGQRLEPDALSAFKNSLQQCTYFLMALSLRLPTATGGAVAAGRMLLDEKANAAEGDFGASRFFGTGIEIGPFKDDGEAADCLRRRLSGNVITFAESVIDQIVQIEARVPHAMIQLASSVYVAAANRGQAVVEEDLLASVFQSQHAAVVTEAVKLLDDSSEVTRGVLRSLVAIAAPATPEDVATQMYPGTVGDPLQHLVRLVRAELERIAESSACCMKMNDHYRIADPARAYALQRVLRSE